MRHFHPSNTAVLPSLLALLFVIALPFTAKGETPEPIVILCVGGSSVATFDEESALRGWGQMLGKYLVPEARVENAAKSGTSSRSFIARGLWPKALGVKPQYVLIQFAHNDRAKDERGTDPDTTYRDFLRQYIRDSREAGAQPVLVGAMTSRNFRPEDGVLRSVSIRRFVDAMREVAAEEKVPFVDLYTPTFAYYEKLGAEESRRRHAPGERDINHFNATGADFIARIVADGLAREVPALRPYLRHPDTKLAVEVP